MKDTMSVGRWVWVAAVAAISLAPFAVKHRLYTTGALHDAGHVLVFAFTTVLVVSRCETLRRAVLLAISVGMFAASLELAQWLAYGNDFELHDLSANSLGVGIGLVSARLAGSCRSRDRKELQP